MTMPAFEDKDVYSLCLDIIAPFFFLCLLTYLLTSLLFCFHPYIHLCCLFTVCPRCDITAVLLYVEQLMWSLCESPEALVRSHSSSVVVIIAGGSDWPYQIHSLCEQLLTVLVIVTAPLTLLYRFVCTVYVS